ncbi:lipoprotein insertase outer membrane protein LolB [Massilia sp. TSP1-1-2]|uniref:lipoprotein insertase outer membrane protein LolB n=1 Tax=unclassified Massilia TaxID=2609279 RepID=UPI003CEF30D0
MKNNLLRAVATALACALLSACATTGTRTAPAPDTVVGAYRDAIDLTGRLLVNYERDGKPDLLSVKFAWAQTARETGVSLLSPTGQTMAKISVTPDAATLTQGGQVPRIARDIDTLAAQTLGFALPVSGLRDWLQGYATLANGKRFAASPANNTVTTADGWKLTFVSWQEVSGQDAPGALPVPRRIDAQRDATATSGQLALRILVDPKG